MYRTARAAVALAFLLITSAPPAAGATWTAPRDCSRGPHPTGPTSYEVAGRAGGGRYLLYVPRAYDGTASMPVIVDFHGSGSYPAQELELSAMDRVAERAGFLLILPAARVPFPGGGHAWNVPHDGAWPDDVGFVEDVLEDAARRVCLARNVIYLTGFSGGARVASEVACALGARVRALAVVGGLRAPEPCPGPPLPVLAFHGTADPINPFEGGGPSYWSYGVEAAMRTWAERNGCGAEPAESRRSAELVVTTYSRCREGVRVVLHRLLGVGHVWPGSRLPLPVERFGPSTEAIDATAAIADFFARARHRS